MVTLKNGFSKTSGKNFSPNIFQATEFEIKNVKAAYSFFQRNKHILNKMSHVYEKLHCCKDKNADDIATEYTEEAKVSELELTFEKSFSRGRMMNIWITKC